MLIDTHCHLTDERLSDIEAILDSARAAGVEKVIVPSTSVEDARKALAIAEKYGQYCLVGIHPEEVENLYRFRVKPGMTNDDTGLPQPPGRLRNDNENGDEQAMPPGRQGLASQEYLQGESFERGMDPRLREDDKDLIVGEINELEEIIKSSKRVVGVGEIGMDFHYDKERKTETKQRELFRAQMEMAQRNNLPVAIHMRDAEEEMREELENLYRFTPSGTSGPLRSGMTDDGEVRLTPFDWLRAGLARNDGGEKFKLRGQFHCFAGSGEFLEMIIEMGFYVSFGGNITYKSAGNLRELLKKVPLARLLLETDSPYLPPEPLRGTVNTPGNVKITAAFLAKELSIDLPWLAETTTQNAKCLYSLDI